MKRINFVIKNVLFIAAALSISLLAAVAFSWQETEISRFVLLPRNINIIPPSADLPKEIANFSGRWEGTWENILNWILIVEKIDDKKAEVISATGDCPRWYVKNDYSRIKAKINGQGQKPRIEFSSGLKTFTIVTSDDPKTLIAEMEIKGNRYKTVIKKIED